MAENRKFFSKIDLRKYIYYNHKIIHHRHHQLKPQLLLILQIYLKLMLEFERNQKGSQYTSDKLGIVSRASFDVTYNSE